MNRELKAYIEKLLEQVREREETALMNYQELGEKIYYSASVRHEMHAEALDGFLRSQEHIHRSKHLSAVIKGLDATIDTLDTLPQDEAQGKIAEMLSEIKLEALLLKNGEDENMKLKKTRQKNRFIIHRINRNNGEWVIRVAACGYGFCINPHKLGLFLLRGLEFWIVIIATLALFRLGQVYALQQRGYIAYGGEYTLLLLPLIYYYIKSNIKLLFKPYEEVTSNKGKKENR